MKSPYLVIVTFLTAILGFTQVSYSESQEPTSKIIAYKEKFRRNSPDLIEHLSLVIFFPNATGLNDPYEVRYEIEDRSGKIYKGTEKYIGAKPCKVGYTGVTEILECPRPAFEEIILKSQQQTKPAITKDLVQNALWWVTKGFEYPSFDALTYKIRRIDILDRKTNTILWTIH
jgi:hypothetical protein